MQRIRELRNLKGFSQARLAVTAGMDPATLNRIEQGKGNPNLKTLEKLADALGVGIADLLEEAPKAQAPSSPRPAKESHEERRHWKEETEEFIEKHEPLIQDQDLTEVVSSKLLRRAVDRLREVNDARKKADADDDYPLDELNDIQIAFIQLQRFSQQVLMNHKEKFGEVDKSLSLAVDNTRGVA